MSGRKHFIRSIFEESTKTANNGIRYIDMVPKDHKYNALGERADRANGCRAGPVVVRPIYPAIYEEIKYREKHLGSSLHLITGTSGVGKSFFAPVLARLIMNDEPDAIIAYWNEEKLYLFSRKQYAGWLDPVGSFHERVIPKGRHFSTLEAMCADEDISASLNIIRDPPRDPRQDEGGNLDAFDPAKRRFLLASYGCYLIPIFSSKGAQFYYLPPWSMELLEAAVAAGLIGLADQTTEAEKDNINEGSPAVKSTNSNGELDGGEDVSNATVVDDDDNDGTNPKGDVVNESSKDEVMHEEDGGGIDTAEEDEDEESVDDDTDSKDDFDGLEDLHDDRKPGFRHVKEVYKTAKSALDIQSGVALSDRQKTEMAKLRSRFLVVGGSLRSLLFDEDQFQRMTGEMEGKVKAFFGASAENLPTAPGFVDQNRYYGTCLHKVPTAKPTTGSPLGLVHSSMKWASPFVENLAIQVVLQNVTDHADRFATIMGGSGDTSTYCHLFEGQCHRDLSEIDKERILELRLLSLGREVNVTNTFLW